MIISPQSDLFDEGIYVFLQGIVTELYHRREEAPCGFPDFFKHPRTTKTCMFETKSFWITHPNCLDRYATLRDCGLNMRWKFGTNDGLEFVITWFEKGRYATILVRDGVIRRRIERCRAACIVIASRRPRWCMHGDLRRMLAASVWETRCDEKWD